MTWRRAWQSTPVFLPGEFHEQRSLGGYSPWGRQELGMALFSIEGKETIQKEIKRITEDYTSFYGQNEQYEMLRS